MYIPLGHTRKDSTKGDSKSDGAPESTNGAQTENTDSNQSAHSGGPFGTDSDQATGDSTGSSTSSTTTPRNNYFIKLNQSDGRDVGFGVFGKFSDSQMGTVSFGSAAAGLGGKDGNGTMKENYFLQFASGSASEARLVQFKDDQWTSKCILIV